MTKPSPEPILWNPLSILTHRRPQLPSALQIEACDALEQLSTAATRITNNVPTVQLIDQIMGALSDQVQAQQLRVQREIHKRAFRHPSRTNATTNFNDHHHSCSM
uniref:Uncharacterized protein n=1 Tax=Romanomermis culicivorax TaxID=13658 RepID=A0A915K559_ROMCU